MFSFLRVYSVLPIRYTPLPEVKFLKLLLSQLICNKSAYKMTFEFLNFAQTVSPKIIRPPLQIHHGKQSKEKLEMWRNQFVHYGKQATRLYALNFMNPHCKAKKKQTKKKKGSYLSSCWCWCCNRSYLCLWFRITEKEGERAKGGKARREEGQAERREREGAGGIREKARKCLWTKREK